MVSIDYCQAFPCWSCCDHKLLPGIPRFKSLWCKLLLGIPCWNYCGTNYCWLFAAEVILWSAKSCHARTIIQCALLFVTSHLAGLIWPMMERLPALSVRTIPVRMQNCPLKTGTTVVLFCGSSLCQRTLNIASLPETRRHWQMLVIYLATASSFVSGLI